MSSATVPILVASCDAYADVWSPFFTLFFRHWPDCPYPIHLGTNFESFDDPRVRTIRVGADRGWAAGLSSMLARLSATHVLLFLEDFFLERQADDAMVQSLVAAAQRNPEVASIRLAPLPPPSEIRGAPFAAMPELLRIVPPGTPYRVSAQPAVWRVEALRRYLRAGFTAWDFELIGSQLADLSSDVFLGPVHAAIAYDHAIEKGRWRAAGIRICRENGIEVATSARGIIGPTELGRGAVMAALRRNVKSAFHSLTGVRGARLLQRLLVARHLRRAARRSSS
ncbi:MAG TPA: hypothetical protein VE010_13885 [Thermoanaerobaculia bacterium]|nr:hypothetical protein [Thermoanaerobaculia bacterium]